MLLFFSSCKWQQWDLMRSINHPFFFLQLFPFLFFSLLAYQMVTCKDENETKTWAGLDMITVVSTSISFSLHPAPIWMVAGVLWKHLNIPGLSSEEEEALCHLRCSPNQSSSNTTLITLQKQQSSVCLTYRENALSVNLRLFSKESH